MYVNTWNKVIREELKIDNILEKNPDIIRKKANHIPRKAWSEPVSTTS